MVKVEKFAEFDIHDYAIEILHEEIRSIKRKKVRSDEDMVKLDKMVRTYAVLMDSLRSNIKERLHDKLGPEPSED